MRTNAFSLACLLAGGMLAMGTPSAGRAQSGTLSIAGEVGPRTYTSKLNPLAIGKFEEYRDMQAKNSTSPLFEQLLLKYTPADSFGVYTLSVRKLFDRDQSVYLHAARPGEYDFQFRWDRIPHTYSTTARSPGDELSNPGFNTLPAVRPDSNAWRNAPYIGAVRSQWDPMKASLSMTPNENLDFKADYTRIAKKGGIPRSISFSGSSGPQREYVSPIDQTVSDIRLSQGYTSAKRPADSFVKSYQVNVAYAYSMFDNAIKSTMVDNPQLSASTLTTGTAVARVSLEPNNSAQTISANGAVVLDPWRTRVMGSVNMAYAKQNDAFMAQTSNAALAGDANYGKVSSLMRPSLDGKAKTQTYNVSLTTHPMDKLTVAARMRSFDYSNSTEHFQIAAMVVSDRSIALADSEKFEPHPYTKTNTDLSANYLLRPGLSLSAGYAMEDWKRDPEVRNIEKTSETTPRVSVDYAALDWFTLRASYAGGSRRGKTTYTESATEILTFRRFDEADRDRTRFTLMGTVMPTDEITVALTVQTGNDKFPNSQYGIQRDSSMMLGVDVDWAPSSRFGVSVGWSQEDIKDSADYRYRTGAAGSLTYDNPTFRWMNTNRDQNTSLYVNVNAELIPDKLDLVATWSMIDSHWRMYNVNPTAPSCPAPATGQTACTAANLLNATAQNWPDVTQRLEPMSIGLRYVYSPEWAMTLRYQTEKYQQNDFRTLAPVFTTNSLNGGPLLPVGYSSGDIPSTIGQVTGFNTGQYHFLGNNYHPYTADWLTLTFSYHPSLLQWGKGRSAF